MQNQELVTENLKLKMELQNLRTNHEELFKECTSTYETIKYLENVVKQHDETVKNLDIAYKTAKLTAEKLNKAFLS